jgi:hypothetical protein
VEHQRRRWMRPDAERWMRPDAARFFNPPYERKDRSDAQGVISAGDLKDIQNGHLELKRLISELQFELAYRAFQRKYRPDQPRVPAGSREGGRWTTEGGVSQSTDFSAAKRRGPSRALVALCTAQYAKDTFHCTMVGLRACHEQAALRYANCLQEKPIPPLNY